MTDPNTSNDTPIDDGSPPATDGAVSEEATTAAAPSPAHALQQAIDEQRDRFLRLAAEYDNFRKRSVKERQEAEARGQAEVVRGLIDALDDLARFAHVDPASVDAHTVVEGAAMVERKLLKSLGGHGLEVEAPLDKPFNPEWHEAVSTTPAASPEEDHLVAQVFQPGYIFRGQLLRPARVVVKQWNG